MNSLNMCYKAHVFVTIHSSIGSIINSFLIMYTCQCDVNILFNLLVAYVNSIAKHSVIHINNYVSNERVTLVIQTLPIRSLKDTVHGGMTPWVTAPNDINPSDATASVRLNHWTQAIRHLDSLWHSLLTLATPFSY